jgi:hypothetical protein
MIVQEAFGFIVNSTDYAHFRKLKFKRRSSDIRAASLLGVLTIIENNSREFA